MLRTIVVALVLSAIAVLPLAGRAQPRPPGIVAAEAVYADVARQIAGPQAAVTGILGNPDEDPHLFEASPSVARAIADARIVVANGADYDPWMQTLLRAAPRRDRRVIDVGALLQVKPGANPHLWYDPSTMPAFARALAAQLSATDPAHRELYRDRLARFLAALAPLDATIGRLRRTFAGTPVAATEPVFDDMFAALGMAVREQRFQVAVMNGTEPAASDIAAFETDLRRHRVRLLVYNRQVSDPIATRMARLARESHVPVLGVTETEPPGTTYQAWMMGELEAIDHALPR